jgi:hypothetical protein
MTSTVATNDNSSRHVMSGYMVKPLKSQFVISISTQGVTNLI